MIQSVYIQFNYTYIEFIINACGNQHWKQLFFPSKSTCNTKTANLLKLKIGRGFKKKFAVRVSIDLEI